MSSRILLTLAIAAILISLPITALANLEVGLLAHWSFDDCTATDVTGNGHDGEYISDPDCVPGTCCKGLLLDGIDDEVTITENLDDFMFANESFSVSTWIQVTDNVNEYRPYVYFGRDQTHTGNSEFILSKCRSGIFEGRIYAAISRHGAFASHAWSILPGDELINTGWLHLVGVVDYEQQEVRLYINGEPQTPSDDLIEFDMTTGSKPFTACIGAYEHSQFHNSSIDEVRIYDRALTQAEIQALYEQCLPAFAEATIYDPEMLYAYWAFAVDPIEGEIYVGNFDDEFTASDINLNSVRLNWNISPVSCEVVPFVEGFEGEVLKVRYNMDDFILPYLPIFDTVAVDFNIVGNVLECERGFCANGAADIVGKDSRSRFPVFLKSGDSELDILPSTFSLHQNYPNPFNPTTEISFNLPVMTNVRLEVYNIAGQKVTTLVDEQMQAGPHSVTWNGKSDSGEPVASGMYFYRIEAGNYSESRKMLLLK